MASNILENDDLSSDEENTGAGVPEECEIGVVGHTLRLNDEEMRKCLWLLQTNKKRNDAYQTRTSKWNKSPKVSSAAYKLFRMKRWLLTDENLVFDPLCKNQSTLRIDPNKLLWTEADKRSADSDDVTIPIRLESVDEIIATNLGSWGRLVENLQRFDALLDNIDGPLSVEMQSGRFVSEMLAKSSGTLPSSVDVKVRSFLVALLPAMLKTERNEKLLEITFQNIFTRFFSCIVACLQEEKAIDCDSNLDGFRLDNFKLPIDGLNFLEISSQPDLFIYERNHHGDCPRIIAVVEAKGKYRDCIIHSDEEDEPVIELEEESEEELPYVERVIKRKHKKLKNIQPEMRRVLRRFLPQLVGEMICCNESYGNQNIFAQYPGYSLGIAVIGFEIYFVSLLTSDSRDYPRHMFFNPTSYTNVFITKPFDLRQKNDRRKIMKVLTAACLIKRNNFSVPRRGVVSVDGCGVDLQGNNVLCLDMTHLKPIS